MSRDSKPTASSNPKAHVPAALFEQLEMRSMMAAQPMHQDIIAAAVAGEGGSKA